MEYEAFISRLSVEEVSIKASSRRRASEELRKRIAPEENDSAVVHYGPATRGRLPNISHNFKHGNILSLRSSEQPRAEKNAVRQYLFDQLNKSWIVVEKLAVGITTEDLTVERGETGLSHTLSERAIIP